MLENDQILISTITYVTIIWNKNAIAGENFSPFKGEHKGVLQEIIMKESAR